MVRAVVAFHTAERAFKGVSSNSISGSYRQLLPGTGLAYWRKVRPEAPTAIKWRVSLSNHLSAVIQCGDALFGAMRSGTTASTEVCREMRRCARDSYVERFIDLRHCVQSLIPRGHGPVGLQNDRATCARGLRNASDHTLARNEIH